jgi:hypothetical protein
VGGKISDIEKGRQGLWLRVNQWEWCSHSHWFTAGSSEKLVNIYLTMWHYIPENDYLTTVTAMKTSNPKQHNVWY